MIHNCNVAPEVLDPIVELLAVSTTELRRWINPDAEEVRSHCRHRGLTGERGGAAEGRELVTELRYHVILCGGLFS